MILEKALEYTSSLGHSDFLASIGWLEKFKKKHELSQKTVCFEIPDTPLKNVRGGVLR